jgi:hypothetical protein
MTTEPEVRPDWTGPRIVDWVKTMKAPARAHVVSLDRHPTDLIAERPDAPFDGSRPRRSVWAQVHWAIVCLLIMVGVTLGFLAVWS